MNAPMFAQLRYAGPADTLVAAVGGRGVRPVGADRDRRRHRRPAGRSADPRLAQGPQNARLESAVTGMVIDKSQARRTLQRIRGWSSAEITGRRPAADRQRQRHGRPSPAASTALDLVQRHQARCSTATTSPRRSPGRCDPLDGRGRDDQRQSAAQQGPLHARPGQRRGAVPQLNVARGLDPRT
jgi:hypothetical protein